MVTCGHTTPTGPCERTVADESDLCFMHDGGSPPGHGAPVGNDNAAGNSGGGAPQGNANAVKYHGWSDPNIHYNRLEGEAKKWVDDRTNWYVELASADLSEEEITKKARRLATIEHQGWLSIADELDRGIVLEREVEYNGQTFTKTVVNPATEAMFRLSSKERDLRDELEISLRGGD